MNIRRNADNKPTTEALLSTMWIFLAINYIYRDILSNMEPGALQGYLDGWVGDIAVTQGFLLAAALMMEIPFAMIFLSRVFRGTANRLANIIAGILLILIEIGTMGMGTTPTQHYLFYSVIVIACNLFIIGYAWKQFRGKSYETSTRLPVDSSQ